MKKVSAVVLGLIVTTSVMAQTQYSPYLSISGGVGYPSDSRLTFSGETVGEIEYDSGAMIEGAIGLKIDQCLGSMPFRVELAGFYEKNDIKSVEVLGDQVATGDDVTVGTLLFNGYVDFPLGYGFAPYVLGGIGYAYVSVAEGSETDNFNQFCGQIGAGLGYSITDHLILDLRYKYFMAQTLDINDVRAEIAANQVLLGLRYEF